MIDEEMEVRQMFLEEAQEYINIMDDNLIGIDTRAPHFKQIIDGVLRAAHSLKGAAGIMQFDALSHTAHRLEDAFKIIQSNRPFIDINTERLLLNAVELLRQIILVNRQGKEVGQSWLENHNISIFEPLENYLSKALKSDREDDTVEEEVDIAVLMFENEVEEMLKNFEAKLSSGEINFYLIEDLVNLSNDLSELGEMLELPKFVELSQSIARTLDNHPQKIGQIAFVALEAWRRSQALIILGHKEDIPSDIDFNADTILESEEMTVLESYDPAISQQFLEELEEESSDTASFDTASFDHTPVLIEAELYLNQELTLEDLEELADLQLNEESQPIFDSEQRLESSNENRELTIDSFFEDLFIEKPNNQIFEDLSIEDSNELNPFNELDLKDESNPFSDNDKGIELSPQILPDELSTPFELGSLEQNLVISEDIFAGLEQDYDLFQSDPEIDGGLSNLGLFYSGEELTIDTLFPSTSHDLDETVEFPQIVLDSNENNLEGLDDSNLDIEEDFWQGLDSMVDSFSLPENLVDLDSFENSDILTSDLLTIKSVTIQSKDEEENISSSSSPKKDLSQYFKEPAQSETLAFTIPDTLFDLLEDLEASQETDIPESFPTSALDLVTTYVKDSSIRLPISRLDQLHSLSGELLIGHNSFDGQLKRLRELLKFLNQRVRSLDASNNQLTVVYDRMTTELGSKQPATNLLVEDFDSLEMDRFSDLHSMSQSISEVIVQIQEVVEDVDITLGEAEQNNTDLTGTFRQLQTTIKQTRMRPLSDVVGRFPRVIRSLSLQHDKKVEVIINGGETLLEQSILDILGDPLNHLLRNAFDHGIEDKATRLKNGKKDQGKIEISAKYKDDKIIISISDDGRGIDTEKIREKAKQSLNSLNLDQVQLATMSTGKLIKLIFEPGFSTADEVTSLSGRGVGMDVVRTNLQQIGAEVDIETKLGIGTKFTIVVPFTLLSTRIVLIEVDRMLLGIPSNLIQEVVPITEENSIEKERFAWQDLLIPVFSLSDRLRLNCYSSGSHLEDKPSNTTKSVLVVKRDDQLTAIPVNACWGEQEVNLVQPEGHIRLPNVFWGCAIAANGQAIPLLNLQILAESKLPTQPINSSQLLDISILVVDDSVNVRRYLALILKKAGFKVEQAKDGEEAIDKLLNGLSVSAVISDVEMPRLDGYGLLSRIRKEKQFQDLPVVMLTSRSGEKHRQLALNLGATDYFSKPFEEEKLIQTLKNLTDVNSHFALDA